MSLCELRKEQQAHEYARGQEMHEAWQLVVAARRASVSKEEGM